MGPLWQQNTPEEEIIEKIRKMDFFRRFIIGWRNFEASMYAWSKATAPFLVVVVTTTTVTFNFVRQHMQRCCRIN